MNEDVPEQFDLEQFKDELIQTTEKYAEAAHYTYGSGHTSEEEAEHKNESARLYEKLLEICVNALKDSEDKSSVMGIIDTVLLNYVYKVGYRLFGVNSTPDFYREIAIRLLKIKVFRFLL